MEKSQRWLLEIVNLWTDGAETGRITASYERYTTRTQSWITDERLLKVDARKRVVDADSLKAVAELTRSRNQTWAGQFPLADVISNQVM